jgi:hypothetical protein
MPRSQAIARINSLKLDDFANEMTMAVWNAIAELPQFQHLSPKDYPPVFEAVQRALKEVIQ